MENSKLVVLLRTFSSAEWRRFLDLVASPFFNTRPELIKLAEYLESQAPALSGESIDKEVVYTSLFPEEPFDNKQMGYLMNYLLRLGEQFLGLERMLNDSLVLSFQTMKALQQRDLDKHFHFLLNRGLKELDKHFPESSERYQYYFRLSRLKSAEATRMSDLKQDLYRGEARTALDTFHVLETLKIGCERQRSQSISSSLNGLTSTELLDRFFEGENEPPPLLAMYHALYLALSKEDKEIAFRNLLDLIQNHADHVDEEELRVIFQYASEHCIECLEIGNKSYAGLALDFYLEGLRLGIFYHQELVDPNIFLHTVRLFLTLGKKGEALQFIRQYRSALPAGEKDQIVALARGLHDFHLKEYSRALDRLPAEEFQTPRYYAQALILRIKISYAVNDLDQLLNDLAQLTLFIRKDKNLDPDYRKEVNEFCALLHQILRRNPKKHKVLQQQIEQNDALREREWLMRVLDQEVD